MGIQTTWHVSTLGNKFYNNGAAQICTHLMADIKDWANPLNTPGQHFYIKELARLRDGRFVIPIKWLCTECTDVYHLTIIEQTCVACLHVDKFVHILAANLMSNILDLRNQGMKIQFDSAYSAGVDTRIIPPSAAQDPRATNVYTWSDVVGGRCVRKSFEAVYCTYKRVRS
ncbi:hypothetical protein BC835DRAFT_1374779 [Cytidiella melzeri]|nr:hypothetical protein BC835DRAFT_1374779 [Cytidiella melzeri]